MTIREKIQAEHSFTERENQVATYMLAQPLQVADMNIRELAQCTYTSTPTVIRVCHKLGFDGFSEFKRALLLELEQEKHVRTRIDASHPFARYETPNRIVGALHSLYAECVESTATLLDVPAATRMAAEMFQAKRLFLYAVGDTQITCQRFANKLVKLNRYPIFVTHNYQELAETRNIRPEDYALFVTYKGRNEQLLTCAHILKRRGVPRGLITGNGAGAMVPLFPAVLTLPNTEQGSNIATFYSQIAIGFTLDVLYSLIYEMDYERHTRHKEMMDEFS